MNITTLVMYILGIFLGWVVNDIYDMKMPNPVENVKSECAEIVKPYQPDSRININLRRVVLTAS